jgi:hypothetical protein
VLFAGIVGALIADVVTACDRRSGVIMGKDDPPFRDGNK